VNVSPRWLAGDTHQRRIAAVLFVILALALWSGARSPSGDLSNHYTDHLRHEAESLALLRHGFDIYRRPYAETTRDVGLTDGQHQGLWPERTAPYPPLGILFFAPIAGLERAGDLTPGHAHALAVGLLVLIACLACLAGGRLARRSTCLFQLGFVLLGGSLLFGAGANGFFDVLYCLAGFLGLEALANDRNAHALAFFALAGSLHFRAAVLLPAAGFALWRGLAGPDRRRTLWVLGISCLALAPVACAALVLDTHAFVVVNPLRVKLVRTCAFAALAAAGMAFALSRRRPLTALTLFCASLLL